jgi:hypothetical protein
MSTQIGGPLYVCPRCMVAGEWTDGTSVAAGDECDEYWCQHCGEESPLEDCEHKAAPYTEQETTK